MVSLGHPMWCGLDWFRLVFPVPMAESMDVVYKYRKGLVDNGDRPSGAHVAYTERLMRRMDTASVLFVVECLQIRSWVDA